MAEEDRREADEQMVVEEALDYEPEMVLDEQLDGAGEEQEEAILLMVDDEVAVEAPQEEQREMEDTQNVVQEAADATAADAELPVATLAEEMQDASEVVKVGDEQPPAAGPVAGSDAAVAEPHGAQAEQALAAADGDAAQDAAQAGAEAKTDGAGEAKAAAPLDPDDPLAMPPHGTEVFLSRLPREATETQLRAFCEKAGPLHELRMPRDPHSAAVGNKGHAFAVYKTREGAVNALEKLNQTELPDFLGKPVSILMSQVKNRLFLGNVPKDLTREAVEAKLNAEVRGITHLELMIDKETGLNRGFAFLEFYNYAAADAARRKMSGGDFKLRDRTVTVTWAEPRKIDIESDKVKSIYVGGLPETADEAKMRAIFLAYGKIENIVMLRSRLDPTKFREYAFVHFEERASALRAVEDGEAEKHSVDGKQLTVHLAKPATFDNAASGPMGYNAAGGRDNRNAPYGRGPPQYESAPPPRGRSSYVPGLNMRDRPFGSAGAAYGGPPAAAAAAAPPFAAGPPRGPRPPPPAAPPPPPPPRKAAPPAGPPKVAPPPAPPTAAAAAGGGAGGYYDGDDMGDEEDDYEGGGGAVAGYGNAAMAGGFGAYGFGGGMTMVPMMLPNGQMGYVMMAAPGGMAPGAMMATPAMMAGASGRRAAPAPERAPSAGGGGGGGGYSDGGYDAPRARGPPPSGRAPRDGGGGGGYERRDGGGSYGGGGGHGSARGGPRDGGGGGGYGGGGERGGGGYGGGGERGWVGAAGGQSRGAGGGARGAPSERDRRYAPY